MSVISSVTVTPNRIEIIARYLESRGARGVSRVDLEKILSPEALRRTTSEVSSTVTEALTESFRLGLAERFDFEGSEFIRFVASTDLKPASLLERLERILLNSDTAETTGQSEFRRALAWLLSQDPRTPMKINENPRLRIQEQCSGAVNSFDLTDYSRAQNFYYWARYLGYAWCIGQKTGVQGETQTVVVPDPTVALLRHLPRLMSLGERRPLAQLIEAWSDLVPVLEGGTARIEVEELMEPALLAQQGMLSRSTSLALERLDRRGVIRLERQADAPVRLLATWPDPQPFTHVTYTRTA